MFKRPCLVRPWSVERIEYWKAMELMGRYSSVNHDIIHQGVLNPLGAVSVLTQENHHNFAWKMQCGDEEVVVHRKGATPADRSPKGHPGFSRTGEVSMAYEEILDVMARQKDLAGSIARFDSEFVKMAEPDVKRRKKQNW